MAGDKRSVSVYLSSGFAMLVWGLSFLAAKDVVSHVPVFTLLFLKFGVATLLLGLIGGVMRTLAVSRRDLAVLAGLAILSPIGYFLFETFGVANTQPSHVSVIMAAIPTVVLLIPLGKHQEHATWQKGVGLGVFCSAGAFLALHYSLTRLSATQVAALTSFIPVITLFVEVLLIGTRLSLLKGLGTAVAKDGVLLVQTGNAGHRGIMLEGG